MNCITFTTHFLVRLQQLAAALLLLALGAGTLVQAHGNATGVVKERMEMMETLGDSMKEIKPLVRQKSRFDPERVAELAESIHELSGHIATKFPEGSIEGPSEALPAIWEDWDRFSELLDQMGAEAARLGQVAEGGNRRATMKQFISLGKTCKGCHTDFRQDKEDED